MVVEIGARKVCVWPETNTERGHSGNSQLPNFPARNAGEVGKCCYFPSRCDTVGRLERDLRPRMSALLHAFATVTTTATAGFYARYFCLLLACGRCACLQRHVQESFVRCRQADSGDIPHVAPRPRQVLTQGTHVCCLRVGDAHVHSAMSRIFFL